MKQFGIGLAALALLSSGFVQKPDEKRVDAIWNAAQARISRQNDFWFHSGDPGKAIQLLKMVHILFPHDGDVATNLGFMMESEGMNDQALAVYIHFKDSNPKDPDAPQPLAGFYLKKKAYDKIPPILEPTLKLRPHANAFRILAHAYERMNMLTDAKRVWEGLIAQDPKDDAAKLNLNRVLGKLKGGDQKKT